jgi:hypothetical protein
MRMDTGKKRIVEEILGSEISKNQYLDLARVMSMKGGFKKWV